MAMLDGSTTDGLAEIYLVSCHACQKSFDGFHATWCACLVTRRSLRCPSCARCFCKAPQAYKQQFWENAPKALRDLAAVEHSPVGELVNNPDAASIGHPLVLIVDDEKDIQRIALAVVSALGYHAIVAGDGEEGMALALKYKPELILTDAFMPRLDGREMCRRIKADPQTASIKVVVMTSLYTASRYKYEAYKEFGADDYLPKPLEFQALGELLKKHLGAKP
jgi:CheY-like chemotaxis protein